MSKLGHVLICYSCADRVGLRESFLMINSAQPCEGCGTTIGYEYTPVPVETADGGIMNYPRWGRLVAPYMEMWRNKVWPVAVGIALQDFAGAHVHEWSAHYQNLQTGERHENCRCGVRRTTSAQSAGDASKEPGAP